MEAFCGERIACPDLNRLRIILALTLLTALPLALTGCGEEDPEPTTVLDRALSRTNLAEFGAGAGNQAGGTVAVQSLGYEDRVLGQRQVAAGPEVISGLKEALGSSSGLRSLVEDLAWEGEEEIAGLTVNRVSGQLDVAGMARALNQAGGSDVGRIAGLDGAADLEETLSDASFDLYAGKDDGVLRRLDLTLALDDPDNALPPTRIRFSLTPGSPGQEPE